MTENEAISYFRMATDEAGNEEFSDLYKEMCRMAIQALEKQIPKKTITMPFYGGTCPSCNGLIPNKEVNYCSNCGQSILHEGRG